MEIGHEMKHILFYIIAITFPFSVYAQLPLLEIEGKPKLADEKFEEHRDANGRLCSAFKIVSDMEGFGYDSYNGIVGEVIDKPGEDLVYVSADERVIMIFHSGYEPLKIILYDAGISLKENQMWQIKIKGGLSDILPVSFVTEPDSVNLEIDGRALGIVTTLQLTSGKHIVTLMKERYKTVKDTIVVDKDHVLFKFQLVFDNEMVLIPSGTFEMGDVFGESDSDEKLVHTVTVNSFYLSKYEITFSEFDAFCEATGRKKPSDNDWGRGLRPAIYISWYDVVEFCNWRSEQEGLRPCYKINKTWKDPDNTSRLDNLKWLVECDFSANGYRLPTEAEWEYAAREGGCKVRFGNGKGIADPNEINFDGNKSYKQSYSVVGVYRGKTVPVGSFSPNRLGLYDMSGNVEEWCWDWYDGNYYQNSPKVNPRGPSTGSNRVLRGGSWNDSPLFCQLMLRIWTDPDNRYFNHYGFRCAQSK